jgi:hypothetical protein
MARHDNQGEQVSIAKHNMNISSAVSGFFAMLVHQLHGCGRGALASVCLGGAGGRRVWSCVAVGCALAALGLSAAAPVFAAGLPGAPKVAQLKSTTESVKKSLVSVSFGGEIETNGAETSYSFEYASSEAGPYTPFTSDATGKIPATEESAEREASLIGLAPETTYYVRVAAENLYGRSSETVPFTTDEEPIYSAVEAEHVTPTSALLVGRFKADGYGAQWRVEYAASKGGPWTIAREGTVTEAEVEAREAEAGQVFVSPVEVSRLSPNTTYYVRMFVADGHRTTTGQVKSFETPGPPVVMTFVTYALEGETIRVLGQVKGGFASGESYEAHYHLEYVSQKQFEASGWVDATSTPETALEDQEHAGGTVEVVDVVSDAPPGLEPGETYHYRFIASNTTAGGPVVTGNEETVTVPTPATAEPAATCPNEAFRIGPGARLPDCRAYEQVTPAEKGSAQDAFRYPTGLLEGVLVGADGEHLFLHDPGVHWGLNSDPILGDYFFSRTPSGWQTTSIRPGGEPGEDSLETNVFNPDLTEIGVEDEWYDSEVAESPSVEFKVGPAGGPYQLVALLPRSEHTELVGESANGSKYVLASEDRTLAGHATGTTSRDDLYEFSEGQLRQLNVLGGSPGTPISTCGAEIAHYEGHQNQPTGNALQLAQNAVSEDGSRVFFTDDCTHRLYMRVNGAETVDIGEYGLVAADPQGTALLLENDAGELVGYNTETATMVTQSSAELATAHELAALGIPVPPDPEAGDFFAHPRDSWFVGDVNGLTAGILSGPPRKPSRSLSQEQAEDQQAFRYDSVEHVVECVSCASLFDPHPRFGAFFNGIIGTPDDHNGVLDDTFTSNGGTPSRNPSLSETVGSANGDFVFFDTTSALLPQDVDGEIEPPGGDCYGLCEVEAEDPQLESSEFSPSSDVYEWRKNGVDGCTHIQGCLALITTGKGGFLNEFLGSDASGRDVFFATDESLAPGDDDTASDIYDARIDGGFTAPSPRPAECEGDSCSTPLAAPNDLTPASATFQGAGDVPGATPEANPKPKAKAKKHAKRRSGTKRKRKKRRKAGGSARTGRAVGHSRGGAK